MGSLEGGFEGGSQGGSGAAGSAFPSEANCTICPHRCRLEPGKTGVCGVRSVQDGKVTSQNYGLSSGLALDPIEKKPLACFKPGSFILSYGSFGCNMRCPFCQNASISTASAAKPVSSSSISPEALVGKALSLRARGNIGIALTYNEPLIAWEYLMDCAARAREAGLVMAIVTNGYACKETWEETLPWLDAANIDLKSFSEEGYRSLGAPGGLETVKHSIASAYEAGIHVEVTTLVVPGFSDDEEAFKEQCLWLAALCPEIPLHITRFFPCHKMLDRPPTPLKTLKRFQEIAGEYLERVFVGNV